MDKIREARKQMNITMEFDTIAAISTPLDEGAISIVRLSGDMDIIHVKTNKIMQVGDDLV